ncbi:uncharacterized protein LOC108704742 [Xenopus laevis]|uniref:Uncharacterized protein LOC108704742 n=1 Tax=Xenopus laevis TaxID=8355 RepID=A0A8J0U4Q3_XENLA|nr:uncharacterized protein LOC108704742 [Xenopus laevis]OCT57532.1 hypothetical protein XELAEV_18003410mg [Xenopus laevis]
MLSRSKFNPKLLQTQYYPELSQSYPAHPQPQYNPAESAIPEQERDMADAMRTKLTQYTPGSLLALANTHGFQRVSIQLFGFYGHGKSSLINLCVSVLRNQPYQNFAGSGWSDGSVIRERRDFPLTNTVCITDNRGFISLDQGEITEASAQLRGLRLVDESVNWDRNMEEKLEFLVQRCHTPPTDFVLPLIVYRGTMNLTTEQSDHMKNFIVRSFAVTGVFPIVVLIESGESQEKISNNFHMLGASYVFALQKFQMEQPERDNETDVEILNILTACLDEADRGIKKRQRLGREVEFRRQVQEQIMVELELEREKVRQRVREEIKQEQDKTSVTPTIVSLATD